MVNEICWLVVSNIWIIFHNIWDIWDNPSHWLILFRGVKTKNQIKNGDLTQKLKNMGTWCYKPTFLGIKRELTVNSKGLKSQAGSMLRRANTASVATNPKRRAGSTLRRANTASLATNPKRRAGSTLRRANTASLATNPKRRAGCTLRRANTASPATSIRQNFSNTTNTTLHVKASIGKVERLHWRQRERDSKARLAPRSGVRAKPAWQIDPKAGLAAQPGMRPARQLGFNKAILTYPSLEEVEAWKWRHEPPWLHVPACGESRPSLWPDFLKWCNGRIMNNIFLSDTKKVCQVFLEVKHYPEKRNFRWLMKKHKDIHRSHVVLIDWGGTYSGLGDKRPLWGANFRKFHVFWQNQ